MHRPINDPRHDRDTKLLDLLITSVLWCGFVLIWFCIVAVWLTGFVMLALLLVLTLEFLGLNPEFNWVSGLFLGGAYMMATLKLVRWLKRKAFQQDRGAEEALRP